MSPLAYAFLPLFSIIPLHVTHHWVYTKYMKDTTSSTGKESANMKRKFKEGDKVEANGNKDCRIVRYPYNDSSMVEVRFWDGSRLVGVGVVPESDITKVA